MEGFWENSPFFRSFFSKTGAVRGGCTVVACKDEFWKKNGEVAPGAFTTPSLTVCLDLAGRLESLRFTPPLAGSSLTPKALRAEGVWYA